MSSLWQASAVDLVILGQLLKKTLIVANHEAIIKAWQERCQQTGYQDSCGVVESLWVQRDCRKTPNHPHSLIKGPGIVQDFQFDQS